ncbi:MAG: acyl-CoA dehydratase activase [Nitrospirota bacterium]
MNYYCGLDIGSTYTKIVLTSGTEICSHEVFRTATGFNDKIDRIINSFCSKQGISPGDIKMTGVTGYGRNNYPKADFKTTEIKAVARSVNYKDPEATMILDIGGQDCKVVYLRKNGTVSDFHISDKCASGTGRFVELLAMRLNLSLEELSRIDLSGAKNIGLSSTCAVFADAEVIKLIAEGKELTDIIYSVYSTIIRRIMSFFHQKPGRVALTGGIVRNRSFVAVLKKILPDIAVYDFSEIACAYGIALIATENDVNE